MSPVPFTIIPLPFRGAAKNLLNPFMYRPGEHRVLWNFDTVWEQKKVAYRAGSLHDALSLPLAPKLFLPENRWGARACVCLYHSLSPRSRTLHTQG